MNSANASFCGQAKPVSATSGSLRAERDCPACGSGGLKPFFDFGEVPTQIGIQYSSRQEALNCRRGRMNLAFCSRCSFVTNADFSPSLMEYDKPYDNDLGFSSVYQEYEKDLIERLTRNYELPGKRVVEIGCGSGGFIKRLCAAAGSTGVGFDPSLEHPEKGSRVELIPGYYSGDSAEPADLIVCRQVFEHLPAPLSFLTELRRGLGSADGTAIYFEVPNFEYVLSELAIWTVIYEHCSYFTRESLSQVFEAAGFEVRRVYESFQGQFLGIEAVPLGVSRRVSQAGGSDGRLDDLIAAFVIQLNDKILTWKRQLENWSREGLRVVLWGAGARAVSFCNLLQVTDDLPYVVDLNPKKEGKYLPGTGQQIVRPAFLSEYRPDVIIVMNHIYGDEIRTSVKSLGLEPEFWFA